MRSKVKRKPTTITEKLERDDPDDKPLDRAARGKVAQGKAKKEVKKALSRVTSKLGPRRRDLQAGGEQPPRERRLDAVDASDPGVARAIPRETVRSGAPL